MLERIEEFYGFLQGNEVEGITANPMPHLTDKEAFSVIYFLQEQLEVLPDEIDQCLECHALIDTYSDGHYVEDVGHYCDGCAPPESEPELEMY